MFPKSVSRIVSQAAPLLASTVTLQKHVDLLKMDAKKFSELHNFECRDKNRDEARRLS